MNCENLQFKKMWRIYTKTLRTTLIFGWIFSFLVFFVWQKIGIILLIVIFLYTFFILLRLRKYKEYLRERYSDTDMK